MISRKTEMSNTGVNWLNFASIQVVKVVPFQDLFRKPEWFISDTEYNYVLLWFSNGCARLFYKTATSNLL